MRDVRVALAAGLALLAAAVVLVLLHSPAVVARANRLASATIEPIASTTRGATYCQAHELLPAGTSAVRVWLDAAYGPRVKVTVSAGGRPATSGARGSGWTGGSVTVPLRTLPRALSSAVLCVSFALRDETIIVQGSRAPAASAARAGRRALAGRMTIEYLRPGERTWASLIASTARRMGLGRAVAGLWIVFVALALLAAVAAVTAAAVLRELS
jgi:hypothetical protein